MAVTHFTPISNGTTGLRGRDISTAIRTPPVTEGTINNNSVPTCEILDFQLGWEGLQGTERAIKVANYLLATQKETL